MTPAEFVNKWKNNTLSESAGAQAFFIDVCQMLGVSTPSDPDNYCFERGATRTGAGHGWADVWKRNYFGWENKGPGGDLGKALKQLMTYALALDSPPLLVVSNRATTQIHTNFSGTPSEVHTIALEEIGTPENLQKLRWVFTDPTKLKPGRTTLDVTADAASKFAGIAQSMAARGHHPQKVAHFLIQCLFSMFAEDVNLLPQHMFERVISKKGSDPAKLSTSFASLFAAMREGGEFSLEDIPYFNGGLFAEIDVIEMTRAEITALHAASKMDWSSIEPSILGTLFERGLDPSVRSPLGANYTDPATIMKIIGPVIVWPLEREWEVAKSEIASHVDKYLDVRSGSKAAKGALKSAQALFYGFIERLKRFRVLDPACGSGNFLYLSLRALKDLEHRANLDAESMGLQRQLTIETSPENVLGIEINPYAAELARITVWIGEIQWMLKNGYEVRRDPVLAKLDHIERRDALLNPDGSNAIWPACDVIVGNPPFLGDKKMRSGLGSSVVNSIRSCFKGRVPGGADLVTYWFEKSRNMIETGECEAAGLVGTNSIRDGASRRVLDRIVASTNIFEAWSDEPWINDGASVRVSLVCFGRHTGSRLNGENVNSVNSNLTPGTLVPAFEVTKVRRLSKNIGVSFQGPVLIGQFEVSRAEAKGWIESPNPNGKSNADVLKKLSNGRDITSRSRDLWVVDFGAMPVEQACLYEKPFEYVQTHVKPTRANNPRLKRRDFWWLHGETGAGWRSAIQGLGLR